MKSAHMVKCQHSGCDARGTHRIVLVIVGRCMPTPLAPKGLVHHPRELEGWRRCEAHQPKDPEAFLSERSAWWPAFSEAFARASFAKHGHVIPPSRALTQVHYLPEDGKIEEIPIYALEETREGAQLERAGTAKIVTR